MREALLHHIWQFKLFSTSELKTTGGELVEVVHPGTLNPNAGPDFLEAKVRIGKTLWAGNVEIHVRATDFVMHGHEGDPKYERLILHVVFDDNMEKKNTLDCPTLELKNVISDQLLSRYSHLINSKKGLPCQSQFMEVSALVRNNWLERMMVERLAERTSALHELAETLNGDLEQLFSVRLAIGFGQKINAGAFETLARSIPWKVLAKHANSVFQLEALLFGQAGMLTNSKDGYQQELKKEFGFLASKFDLVPMDVSLWKYLRLRPANFPSVRIAQLAGAIHDNMPLIANFIEKKGDLFSDREIVASEYWDTHHVFGKASAQRKKRLGKMAWSGIVINSIVPFAIFLADKKGDMELKENWMEQMRKLLPEQNSVVSKFEDVGFACKSAFGSQALIQLNSNYCSPRNCVNCAVGSAMLKQTDS